VPELDGLNGPARRPGAISLATTPVNDKKRRMEVPQLNRKEQNFLWLAGYRRTHLASDIRFSILIQGNKKSYSHLGGGKIPIPGYGV